MKFFFLFALGLLSQTSLQAQDWVAYLSQQQVNDLVDTGDELLLATDAGLVVVNKTTLEKTVFNKANTNLTDNHIQTITQGPSGATWIGTYDLVLSRFDGSDFLDTATPQDVEFNPLTTEPYDLKIAPNGDFWLGTTSGVFHKQGNSWTLYDATDLGPTFFEAWDIEINEAGEVFVASFDIHKFSNGTWSIITGEETGLNAYLGADLFTSSNGDLYVAGDLDQIGRFDGQNWETYDIDLNGSEVIKFTEDVDGSIYFNTQRNGIFKLENDNWVQQSDLQSETFGGITPYFYIDENNSRWMNSNIRLSVEREGDIETILIAEHTIETNTIKSIHKGENEKLYFITGSRDNLSVVDAEGNWSFLPKPEMAVPFEFLNDLLVLSVDDIWLASGSGLYHYLNGEWEFNDLGFCRSLDIDSEGKIYVAGDGKIYMLEDGMISEYNVDNSPLADLIISGQGIDANDNLWIASFEWDGRAAIQKVSTDGVWTTYDPADHPAIERASGDFHFDVNGNVWVPNDRIGAIKFDGFEFTNPFVGNIDQVANYKAFSIESDASGKMYFSHQYGVTTFLDGEWEDLLIEDVPQRNNSSNSTITFDDDGTLWWGSNREGVFSYSPMNTTSTQSAFAATAYFSVYPNPAEDYTTLDITVKEQTNVHALIYNQTGQLISRFELGQLAAGSFQHTIDLAGFPRGVYTVQVLVNGQSSARKLIVQ